MVWVTKNLGPDASPDATYYVTSVTGMQMLEGQCILRGVTGWGDGPYCEPSVTFGVGKSPGNYVVYGLRRVTESGPASATVCIEDLDGYPDPDGTNNCKTPTVQQQ
jgi:hypothetical protein